MNAPAPNRNAPPRRTGPPNKRVSFGKIDRTRGQSVVLYGCGGAGKTTLAALAPPPVAIFDLDNSLPILAAQLPDGLDIRPVEGVAAWQELRDALNGEGWEKIRTVVIDSATRAEELALQWVLRNVKTDKGETAQRIEDFSYGKGFRHIYDTFVALLGDLDRHLAAGRNVVLVAHEATEKHPNPRGEDWLRSEPRLLHTPKNSIRERVRDWADHLLFLGFDVNVVKGKGQGSGTRTLWPAERPHCMAKSRSLASPLEILKHDRALWDALFPAANRQGENDVA